MPTTTLILVRHGSHDWLDRTLCGRMDGVGMGGVGMGEAARVAQRLAGDSLAALYASPLQRTRETAQVIGDRLGLTVRIDEGFSEVDFGDWTGLSFDDLHADPRWAPWNSRRSLTRPPRGESMGEAQMRAVRSLEAICAAHPDQTVAIVSHSDIIKALIAHYLGFSLDFMGRLEIEPASLSTLVVGDWGAKILRVNEGVN